MRTSLDHLPPAKQRELERVVQVLFEEFGAATAIATSDWKRQARILKGPCALFGHRFTVARNWSFRQRPCGGHDRAGLSIPAADIMKRGSDLRKTARARMPGAGVTTDRL